MNKQKEQRFEKVVVNGFDYVEGYMIFSQIMLIILNFIAVRYLFINYQYPFVCVVLLFLEAFIFINLFAQVIALLEAREVYWRKI